MYCEQCGSFIPDGQAYCSNCGAAAPAANTAPAPAPGPVVQPIIQTPAQPAYQQPAYQQPVSQQPQPVQPIYQQPAYQQAVVITPFERPKSNVVAVVGLVFGILTCVISWLMVFNIIPGAVGIVCSSIGLSRKNCGGKGAAVAGLITSIVGISLGFIMLALAMIGGDSY